MGNAHCFVQRRVFHFLDDAAANHHAVGDRGDGFCSGRVADAEQTWKGTSGSAANILADVRASLGTDSAWIMGQYVAERAKGFLQRVKDGRDNGIYLARALVRQGLAKEAMDVLDDVRPASEGTNINLVAPDVLVLISRARYILGSRDDLRDNFPLARGEIAALANDLPVARPLLKLLQEITAPSNIPDVRSDF